MQIIRAGVDSLYIAFHGAVPVELLAQLASAKAQAIDERHHVPLDLADGKIRANIAQNGASGGYTYRLDTGTLGAIWLIQAKADRPNWNFFAKPLASALLAHGFGRVVEDLNWFLAGIGATHDDHAINRIDFAIDIRADDTTIDLDNFVAHPRTKRSPHWQDRDGERSSAVFTGRGIESVTIGKMPGRQIILYDKTAEARAKQNFYWFEAWKIDPADTAARVWRLELRLGKRELKDRRGIKSIADLETNLKRALLDLLDSIRYIAPGQTDSNVSRRKPHPLWALAEDYIPSADLLAGLGDIPPARLVEITTGQMAQTYKSLITGNAAGYAAMIGLDDRTIAGSLSDLVADTIDASITTPEFKRTLARARDKRVSFGHPISNVAD